MSSIENTDKEAATFVLNVPVLVTPVVRTLRRIVPVRPVSTYDTVMLFVSPAGNVKRDWYLVLFDASVTSIRKGLMPEVLKMSDKVTVIR